MTVNRETAVDFTRYMKKYRWMYQELAMLVRRYYVSHSSKPGVIVDMGSGPGLLMKELQKIIPNATLIGVDSSWSMLNIAKKMFLP